MAIISTDLKIYRSETINDSSTNGGRADFTAEVVDAVRNNIFPNVSQTQRTAGVTRYRKIWLANRNADDLALTNAFFHLTEATEGGDRVLAIQGDWRDTQTDIDPTAAVDWRGSAMNLASGIASAATTLDATPESMASPDMFPSDPEAPEGNRRLFITDGTNEDYVTWTAQSDETTYVEYTLDTGPTNTYGASSTAAHVLDLADDVEPTVEDVTATSTSGTFDDTTYPITGTNVGTIDDDWTLTFTSSTAFTISGSEYGSAGTGNTTTNCAPTNSVSGDSLFVIDSDAWGGTWAEDDTLTFTTRPAAVPIWLVQIVPAATASTGDNGIAIRFGGESA